MKPLVEALNTTPAGVPVMMVCVPRVYFIGADGQEKAISLAVDYDFIGDHGSFLYQDRQPYTK